ncbi:MAG: hypothetical protein RLN83_06805 [Balneola sp.]
MENWMDWIIEALNFFVGLLISVGGTSAIIIWLSKKFGDTWAKRYLESYKNELREQFEKEKRKIELEFEKSKTKYLRYSNKQFELYNSLWIQLVDLKDSADTLWENASENNLQSFAETLKETKLVVQKSNLFLENDHYERLLTLLKEFAEYQVGKEKLINLRNKENITDEVKRNIAEKYFIFQNENRKEEYNAIITDIAQSFKEQIKHPSAT